MITIAGFTVSGYHVSDVLRVRFRTTIKIRSIQGQSDVAKRRVATPYDYNCEIKFYKIS